VLAIDDIQRTPADLYLNEELVHLLDALVEQGALVLVASKEPPSCVPNLSAAVVDRLSSGLVVPLAVAGPEARVAFALRISQELGHSLSHEAATLVAERTSGGLYDLAHVVAELIQGLNRPRSLSRDNIAHFLDEHQHQRRPDFSDILRVAAKYYGVSQKVLKGSCRRQSVVLARAMVIFLARRLGGLSYQQIGRGLSGRDHTTIMHSYRKTEALAEYDRATQQAFNDLQRLLSIP
jgi:chromosomal replication initiator protein